MNTSVLEHKNYTSDKVQAESIIRTITPIKGRTRSQLASSQLALIPDMVTTNLLTGNGKRVSEYCTIRSGTTHS